MSSTRQGILCPSNAVNRVAENATTSERPMSKRKRKTVEDRASIDIGTLFACIGEEILKHFDSSLADVQRALVLRELNLVTRSQLRSHFQNVSASDTMLEDDQVSYTTEDLKKLGEKIHIDTSGLSKKESLQLLAPLRTAPVMLYRKIREDLRRKTGYFHEKLLYGAYPNIPLWMVRAIPAQDLLVAYGLPLDSPPFELPQTVMSHRLLRFSTERPGILKYVVERCHGTDRVQEIMRVPNFEYLLKKELDQFHLHFSRIEQIREEWHKRGWNSKSLNVLLCGDTAAVQEFTSKHKSTFRYIDGKGDSFEEAVRSHKEMCLLEKYGVHEPLIREWCVHEDFDGPNFAWPSEMIERLEEVRTTWESRGLYGVQLLTLRHVLANSYYAEMHEDIFGEYKEDVAGEMNVSSWELEYRYWLAFEHVRTGFYDAQGIFDLIDKFEVVDIANMAPDEYSILLQQVRDTKDEYLLD